MLPGPFLRPSISVPRQLTADLSASSKMAISSRSTQNRVRLSPMLILMDVLPSASQTCPPNEVSHDHCLQACGSSNRGGTGGRPEFTGAITMSNNPNETIERILDLGPVMPVIVIDDTKDALPLADALLAGG